MKSIQLITSFFESPFHPDRAPYNEQLFQQMAAYFDITIVRPIAWTEIGHNSQAPKKSDYYQSSWRGISIFYPTFWYFPKVALTLRAWCYRACIKRTLQRINHVPDIYYTTWAYPDAYAAMHIAKKNRRPYVLRVHGSDINVFGEIPLLRQRVKAVVENAALVVSPSRALKSKMEQLGIDVSRVKVVYSGVDQSKFYYKESDECRSLLKLDCDDVPTLLFIGNLKQSKGVIDFVLAVADIVRSGKRCKAFVIGDGPDKEQLEQVITSNNLQQYVQLVGKVKHDKLALWMNACDVLCLPSYAEGMPNVILEGLACQTKVVATRVGGIPEAIVEHDQALVEPGDVAALSVTLTKALFDDQFKTTPAFEIKSYEKIASEMSECIQKLL